MPDHTDHTAADPFVALTPAEASFLTLMIVQARPVDHPDPFGPVTFAERAALLAEADRETERHRLAREGPG
ncbi:MAG: hypothetical protein AVDCRST_MAG70-2233 [uncultured Thermomicrobiales bacterium]|uniref:Uncharacterized protein n=1 Tax=uncultured Thermomicrobiales bacterium TaxID=1645740 RepID=A0A6J4V4A4_9BACT|nr:MAG: hypothetical protein AVDCRST_MAG70-2233 [uncultured Thermomicrobiales bacterium]